MISQNINEEQFNLLSQQHQTWLDSPMTKMLLEHLNQARMELLLQAMRCNKRREADTIAILLEKANQTDTLITSINYGPRHWNTGELGRIISLDGDNGGNNSKPAQPNRVLI